VADLTSGAVNAVTDDQGSVKRVFPIAAVVAAVLVGILIWRRRR
jgi:MYXO-CTERM domain-containing protein